MSRLLSIPRELRDNIYDFVAVGEGKLSVMSNIVADNTDRYFTSKCPLILACKQLSVEYLRRLTTVALNGNASLIFEAIVTDFDFTMVIIFMDSLSPAQRISVAANGNLLINLIFKRPTPSVLNSLSVESQVWLRYCDEAGVSATYQVDDGASGPGEILKFRQRVVADRIPIGGIGGIRPDAGREARRIIRKLIGWNDERAIKRRRKYVRSLGSGAALPG